MVEKKNQEKRGLVQASPSRLLKVRAERAYEAFSALAHGGVAGVFVGPRCDVMCGRVNMYAYVHMKMWGHVRGSWW